MVGKRIEFFYLCIIWNYNEWDSLTRVLILFDVIEENDAKVASEASPFI